ncbi:MAG: hypothetical protein EXS50_00760 [Candidatus Taylorbacteria bacterium]|nr:hypothetical protein [Candidatus Taylorbacteria bacterium]
MKLCITFIVVILTAIALAVFFLRTPYSIRKIESVNVPTSQVSTTSVVVIVPKIKILLVPGHDLLDVGTTYRTINEELLTRKLALNIYDLLKNDDAFEVMITRDPKTGNYIDEFKNYFSEQRTAISDFKLASKKDMKERLSNGDVERDEPISHNKTSARVSNILFGINMWANDNDIDLVLHIHFNNYTRANLYNPGRYTGFSIYVPEHQYDNASSSIEIAHIIESKLKTFLKPSSLPIEKDTVIESQDLIAIGADNSRMNSSILVEYGYIYQPEFTNAEILGNISKLTYDGIVDFYSKK